MNSHILIPKVLLKEFLGSELFYYKYEVNKNCISKGFPKKTFTGLNYYSNCVENFLNEEIENPLKKLLDYVKKMEGLNNKIEIDYSLKNIAWNYIYSIIVRNPKLLKSVVDESEFSFLLGSQTQHDALVLCGLGNELKIRDSFDLTFMINRTNIPFILPIRGLYEYSFNGVVCINIPLNPHCCIMLYEKNKLIQKNGNEKFYCEVTIDNERFIEDLNCYAFSKQVKDGFGCVISHDLDLLEKIKDKIKKE